MARVKRYSERPHPVRFHKRIDAELAKYLSNHPDVTKSDIIQNAVECFLCNKKCKARLRL